MNENNFIIRKADEQDAEGIGFVHYKSWLETYRGLLPESYLLGRSVEKSTAIFKSSRCENVVVACCDNSVVGFCGWGALREDDIADGEIYGIYLLKKYHGMQLGYNMMQYAMYQLKAEGFQKIGLWVLKDNKNAAAFYEKLGFSYSGINKKAEMDKRVTELFYVKNLL